MTRERFRAAYVGLLAVLVLCQSVPLRAAEGTPKKAKRDRGADFFADPALRTFDLEISDTAHTALKQTPRTYIPGTVREGGHTWTNVGIHLKGMGSFRTVDEKPSFALKFDKYLPDQEYCGLTKLMLNNSVQDQTYLAELVATSLFRDAGVPAARVTHCRVRLNGEDLGIYVAIEAMNKRFLKRFFKNTEGNLYEGYLRDITARLDQDNGTDTSQDDLKRLLAACRIADAGERFKQLDRLLDIERFASFAAMEMLIAHWDGYTLHTNNYRVYHDPTSDKMVFVAHGLDSVFIRPSVSVQAPIRSTVSRALFETTEGRQAYERRLRNLYTNVFRFETITNRIEQAMTHLRKANLSDAEMATIQLKVDKMISRIEHRIQRVGDQLAGVPLKHLPFGPDGLAKISEWRDEFDRGTPTFDRPPETGRTLLHIASGGGRTRASWRCMVYMAPGRYRFEGLVKTKGVSGGGVGLRISGSTRNMRIGGDTPWRPMQHDFIVEEHEGGDVELVCEFDAMTGEAWYDLGTLQIRRLQAAATAAPR